MKLWTWFTHEMWCLRYKSVIAGVYFTLIAFMLYIWRCTSFTRGHSIGICSQRWFRDPTSQFTDVQAFTVSWAYKPPRNSPVHFQIPRPDRFHTTNSWWADSESLHLHFPKSPDPHYPLRTQTMAYPPNPQAQTILNGMLCIIHRLASSPDTDGERMDEYLAQISQLPAIKSVLDEQEASETDGRGSEVWNLEFCFWFMRVWWLREVLDVYLF